MSLKNGCNSYSLHGAVFSWCRNLTTWCVYPPPSEIRTGNTPISLQWHSPNTFKSQICGCKHIYLLFDIFSDYKSMFLAAVECKNLHTFPDFRFLPWRYGVMKGGSILVSIIDGTLDMWPFEECAEWFGGNEYRKQVFLDQHKKEFQLAKDKRSQ